MFASKKNGAEEEVDSLIDSMLRLIDYMNQNQPFKKDIFMSFTIEDLQKILHNMEDSNLSMSILNSIIRVTKSLLFIFVFNLIE